MREAVRQGRIQHQIRALKMSHCACQSDLRLMGEDGEIVHLRGCFCRLKFRMAGWHIASCQSNFESARHTHRGPSICQTVF